MERSDARILTTHAGALPRPDDLLALNAERAGASGSVRLEPEATGAHQQLLRGAVQDVVNLQTQLGLDIVNDGEFGKAMRTRLDYGAWISYVIERFTGFEDVNAADSGRGRPSGRPFDQAIKPGSFQKRRDRQAFPEVYADIDREMFGGGPRPMGRPIVGPVAYRGHDALQADIDNLRAAVESGFSRISDAFMTSPAPGTFGRDQNRCYKTQEEFLFAVADALTVEYRAITDAGFILHHQRDPGLRTTDFLTLSHDWLSSTKRLGLGR